VGLSIAKQEQITVLVSVFLNKKFNKKALQITGGLFAYLIYMVIDLLWVRTLFKLAEHNHLPLARDMLTLELLDPLITWVESELIHIAAHAPVQEVGLYTIALPLLILIVGAGNCILTTILFDSGLNPAEEVF